MSLTSSTWAKTFYTLLCTICTLNAVAAPNADIVFVGQVPNPTDFATANATFGNHLASVESIIRGGDLFVRYRSGSIKNLTRLAGYGNSGFQGAGAIAVRDPAVSWDGKKIVFSMVVGAPQERYEQGSYVWQLYEVTGLAENESPVITKVPRQPERYNNISPTYGSDDTIFFTSDRPRNGAEHLYPQRDEYESQPTVTGLWNLDPATGALRLLDHAPSGAFEPFVDSFGRVVYTRWDHLQQDQQADETDQYGAFNFASEAKDAERRRKSPEFFPEPRVRSRIEDPGMNPHDFNHFFPWQINQDGTGHETLNHIGRHELHGYFDRSRNDDDNLQEHYEESPPTIHREIQNFLQISEDPLTPGRYFAIDAPEFQTHAAGQVITLYGPPSSHADSMPLEYITARSTSSVDPENIHPDHSGLYRDPQRCSDGSVVVSHTSSKLPDENMGSDSEPKSRYSFRLKTLLKNGDVWVAGSPITPGLAVSVSYFTPDITATYSGPLWELQPVELISRPRPSASTGEVEAPERHIFQEAGVEVARFQRELADKNLALIVMRNVTTRDSADLQQPFNLKVFGGFAQTLKTAGTIYDISHLQMFQGDQVRGYGGVSEPERGRRVLATLLHDGMNAHPQFPSDPRSSVRVAQDGSIAAVVPARRALTWQLTDPVGSPVIRERYWLTFQPGEIRVCASCHGVNSVDQRGQPAPHNAPEALRSLLLYLREHPLPDGESPPRSDQPAPSKTYSLRTRGPKGINLLAGKNANISIAVSGTLAAEPLSIILSVNGTRCPQTIKNLIIKPERTRTLTGVAPRPKRRRIDLDFYLRSNDTVVTSTRTSLIYQGIRRLSRSSLSVRERTRICSQFSRFD